MHVTGLETGGGQARFRDLGAGGREGAGCLAAVVELLEGLHSEEDCDYHGDSYNYKGQEELRPQGQGVVLLHHWAAKTGNYTTQPTKGVTTPTHVGGELDTGLL